jgi:hypothetical protein
MRRGGEKCIEKFTLETWREESVERLSVADGRIILERGLNEPSGSHKNIWWPADWLSFSQGNPYPIHSVEVEESIVTEVSMKGDHQLCEGAW